MLQAKQEKPLCYGGRWLQYKHVDIWQTDCVTLLQTYQDKHCILTMVEATPGWLEMYSVPHTTVRSIILGLEKQIL